MLKFTIIALGQIKESYLLLGIKEYLKRLQGHAFVEIVELKEEKVVDESEASLRDALEKEAISIQKHLSPKACIMVLDRQGDVLSSLKLSQKLLSLGQQYSHIQWIIGSSHGLSPSIQKKAHYRLSFSALTFPHQLFRLMLLEQLYRAVLIQKGHPYHK